MKADSLPSRNPRWRASLDIAAGLAGAGVMIGALLSPFRRRARSAWGVGRAFADDSFPGDDLVPRPRWAWTHGIDIETPAEAVWPWVAQVGADRAGFYSYQWLENLIGCRIRNADTIHPEWAHRTGGQLRLHPQAPPLDVVSVQVGRSLLAYMPPQASVNARTMAAPGAGTLLGTEPGQAEREGDGRPGHTWVAASWLFLVQPRGVTRCRVISRYRCATSADLPTRLQFGPGLLEPIGFAMDRRMLIGIKQRAERAMV